MKKIFILTFTILGLSLFANAQKKTSTKKVHSKETEAGFVAEPGRKNAGMLKSRAVRYVASEAAIFKPAGKSTSTKPTKSKGDGQN